MAPLQNLSTLLPFFTTLLTITVITTILARLISSSIRRNRSLRLPPGPRKLPMIGNIHQLINHPLIHRRLRDLAQRHGPHVMHLQLGEVPHVVISSAEAAREVMKTHDLVFATRPYLLMAEVVMYGARDVALAPYGDHWRQMRKICVVELLSAKRVHSFRPIREAEVSKLVAGIVSGAVVKVNLMVTSVTSAVAFKTAFGMAKDSKEEAFAGLMDDISDALSGFKISEVFPSLSFLPTLTGFRAQVAGIHRETDALLEEILFEHKDRRRQGGGAGGGGGGCQPEDLVDILLNLQEEDDQEMTLTTEAIKAVILDMFVAGTGTTVTTVEWTMSEMMKNPGIMRKAHEEVRQLFIDNKADVIEEESIDELKYLDSVIQESLRLHQPLPLLVPRETQETVEIGGYVVPAKTKVIINAWAIGRDSRYWTEPEKFNPERFLENDVNANYKRLNFQLIPFGAGRRSCPGVLFGTVVVKLVLANLLYYFDWKLPDGTTPESLDMTEHFGLGVSRKHNLCLIPVEYNPIRREDR